MSADADIQSTIDQARAALEASRDAGDIPASLYGLAELAQCLIDIDCAIDDLAAEECCGVRCCGHCHHCDQEECPS